MNRRKSIVLFLLAMVLAACVGALGEMLFGQSAPSWWSWVADGWETPSYYLLLIIVLVGAIYFLKTLLRNDTNVAIDRSHVTIDRCDVLVLGLSRPNTFTLVRDTSNQDMPIRIGLVDESKTADDQRRALDKTLQLGAMRTAERSIDGIVSELVHQLGDLEVELQHLDRAPAVDTHMRMNFKIQLILLHQMLSLPRSKWPGHIFFIGSSGPMGSAHVYRDVIEFLAELEPRISFQLIEVEFSDMGKIYEALEEHVASVTKRHSGLRHDRMPYVVVDSNGMGQAYSTAAALFSMRRRCVLTYFRTPMDESSSKVRLRMEGSNLEMFIYDLRTIDQNSILEYFL